MSDNWKCPKCGRRSLVMPTFRKDRERGKVNVNCSACGLTVAVPASEDSEKIDVFGDFLDIYHETIKNVKPKAPPADPQYEYNDWDPPASTTVFCKMAGVPYEAVRSRIRSGNQPEEVAKIKERLDARRYKCKVCIKYEKPRCLLKNKTANPEAICKGFEPDLRGDEDFKEKI